MKKIILLIITLALAGAALLPLAARPVIMPLARKALEDSFPGSAVSIGGCALSINSLTLSDVSIKRGALYEMRIGQAGAVYNLFCLFGGRIKELHADDIAVTIDMPGKGIAALKGLVRTGGEGNKFSVDTIRLSHATFSVRTNDVRLRAALSLEIKARSIERIDAKIEAFDRDALSVKNARIKIASNGAGTFECAKVSYDKARIADLKAAAGIKERTIILDGLSADLFGGKVSGNATVALNTAAPHELILEARSLDVDKMLGELDISKRIRMTGIVSGDLDLKLKGPALTSLKGTFAASQEGGTLVIVDEKILEAVAERTKQPLDIIKQSFQDYRYTSGTVGLTLEKGSVILDIALDGDKGKRNISVILHDVGQ
ncbi:MAG: YdbH domain-containing protein [Candidatus Omnitrophica bacterium]|nr:YdbH domain-containing protein [Candidatus Omnitrophota bacterium]